MPKTNLTNVKDQVLRNVISFRLTNEDMDLVMKMLPFGCSAPSAIRDLLLELAKEANDSERRTEGIS